MSEMESSYNDMMAGSIYACIKWIRLTSRSETMPQVADLIESEINVRNDEIKTLRAALNLAHNQRDGLRKTLTERWNTRHQIKPQIRDLSDYYKDES